MAFAVSLRPSPMSFMTAAKGLRSAVLATMPPVRSDGNRYSDFEATG
jgi:hypothetical protein